MKSDKEQWMAQRVKHFNSESMMSEALSLFQEKALETNQKWSTLMDHKNKGTLKTGSSVKIKIFRQYQRQRSHQLAFTQLIKVNNKRIKAKRKV